MEKGLNGTDEQDLPNSNLAEADIYPNESCRKNQMSGMNESKEKENGSNCHPGVIHFNVKAWE